MVDMNILKQQTLFNVEKEVNKNIDNLPDGTYCVLINKLGYVYFNVDKYKIGSSNYKKLERYFKLCLKRYNIEYIIASFIIQKIDDERSVII